MAQMTVPVCGTHLRSRHPKGAVVMFNDVLWCEWFRKARPPGVAVEFVCRGKQRLTRDHIDVDTRFLVVPVFVLKRTLGAVTLRDAILFRGQIRNCFGVLDVVAIDISFCGLPIVPIALTIQYARRIGCPPLISYAALHFRRLILTNRRVRTRTHGGVTGKASDRIPMSFPWPALEAPFITSQSPRSPF